MKRAFFVTGPESSGTRLMTRLLMAAGCYGDDDHEQRLDQAIPDNEPLIVWRRSVPHRGKWSQVNVALNALQLKGYKTTIIVMSRDWHSMAISQELAPHAADVDAAQANIRRAYRHIFACITDTDRFEIVNYEALTQRPVKTVRYLFQRLGLTPPAELPQIYDGNAKYYPAVSLANPVSQLCTQSQFEEPTFQKWLELLKRPFKYRRKYWEFAYIAQALDLAGLLEGGRHGLGFGVGREPLPALFASRGVCVLATDHPEGRDWKGVGQYAAGLDDLPHEGICSRDTFNRFVRYEAVDMNHLPPHLRTGEYDFVWSANSLDHLGSIEAGLKFIRDSMDCLKPGGTAVHTTEFNTDSDGATLDNGPVVLFRERDIKRLAGELTEAGHKVELNLTRGDGPVDLYIDRPPYQHDRHIRIEVGGHVTTSIGLVIRK